MSCVVSELSGRTHACIFALLNRVWSKVGPPSHKQNCTPRTHDAPERIAASTGMPSLAIAQHRPKSGAPSLLLPLLSPPSLPKRGHEHHLCNTPVMSRPSLRSARSDCRSGGGGDLDRDLAHRGELEEAAWRGETDPRRPRTVLICEGNRERGAGGQRRAGSPHR